MIKKANHMKYNSLYIAAFAMTISFNTCNTQEFSATEQKEQELLNNILQHPQQGQTRDYSRRPEHYFQGLSDAIKIIADHNQDSTVYTNLMNDEAVHFINYVAHNEKWPTTEQKLAYIKTELPDQTSTYLEMTLEYNQQQTAPTPSTSIALASQPQQHTFTQTIASLWNRVSSFFTSILS